MHHKHEDIEMLKLKCGILFEILEGLLPKSADVRMITEGTRQIPEPHITVNSFIDKIPFYDVLKHCEADLNKLGLSFKSQVAYVVIRIGVDCDILNIEKPLTYSLNNALSAAIPAVAKPPQMAKLYPEKELVELINQASDEKGLEAAKRLLKHPKLMSVKSADLLQIIFTHRNALNIKEDVYIPLKNSGRSLYALVLEEDNHKFAHWFLTSSRLRDWFGPVELIELYSKHSKQPDFKEAIEVACRLKSKKDGVRPIFSFQEILVMAKKPGEREEVLRKITQSPILADLWSKISFERNHAHGAGPHGAGAHGAGPHGAGPHGAGPHGAGPHGAGPHGAGPHGAGDYGIPAQKQYDINIDYYNVLGVPKEATDHDIRKAYKALALKYHPDKNPDNPTEASNQFKKVAAAYEILGNPKLKADYDRDRLESFPGARLGR